MPSHTTSPWLLALGISNPDPYEPEDAWVRTPGLGRLTVPLGHQYASPAPVPRSRLFRLRAFVRQRFLGDPIPAAPQVVSVDRPGTASG